MMEMKIKVEAPDLAAAIEKLAAAITPLDPSILTPDTLMPGVPAAPAAAPAAVPTQPVTPPSVPTGAPGSAPAQMPMAAPAAAAPANPAPAAGAPVPPPAVPVTTAPTYDLNTIAQAGAALVSAGKMEPLMALLTKYGVAAITQLKPEQYGGFVTELRALGAQI